MITLGRFVVLVVAGCIGAENTSIAVAKTADFGAAHGIIRVQAVEPTAPNQPPHLDDRFHGGGLPAPFGGGRLPDNFGTVIGPGGVVRPLPRVPKQVEAPKKKAPTAAEKAETIRKALAPKPPLSFARRHTLDDLYGKLAKATDEDEAKGFAELIGSIWMRSGSDTATLLMQRAIEAFNKKDMPLARDVLDKLVELQPDWPEAWNKRATVRFVQGDLDGSMADVEHVLKLEPNHFGALEGMAGILQRTGLNKRALQIYRRALAVYPHQPEIEKIVEKLTLEVEGQGI